MGFFAGDLLMSPRLVSSRIMFTCFRTPTFRPRRPAQSVNLDCLKPLVFMRAVSLKCLQFEDVVDSGSSESAMCTKFVIDARSI